MAICLVTGGAGFIGSSLAEELLKKGETVRIVDDFSSGLRANIENLPGKVEVVEGDTGDTELLGRLMRGVEVVFHEAAIPSVALSIENPAATMRVGVQGVAAVLDCARHAGVKRVIFAASSAAYGDTATMPLVETMAPRPLSPYAISKITGEQLLRVFSSLYQIETLSLRYFNVFGPRQDPKSEYAAVIPKFITAAIRGQKPTVFGDGEQTRDFCFIDDTVNANLLAATTSQKLSGEVVNIGRGECVSLNRLLQEINEEAVALGVRDKNKPFDATYADERAGDVRHSRANIDAARALIGYEPRVTLREGIRKTMTALKNR